jgi:predicted TPR repeat methyltransferase
MPDEVGLERLKEVYSARDSKELEAVYDQWAEDYEAHLVTFGYRIPSIMAGLVGRFVPLGATPILDAGVGTGIMGEILRLCKYGDMVGIDLSDGMLKAAQAKGIYRDLRRMVLGDKLDFPDQTFAAVVSVGTFTTGHAPPDSFDELTRITKSGGHILFSVLNKSYLNEGFKEKQAALEQDGAWCLVEMVDPFESQPLLKRPELTHRICVYKVL